MKVLTPIFKLLITFFNINIKNYSIIFAFAIKNDYIWAMKTYTATLTEEMLRLFFAPFIVTLFITT